MSDDFSVHSTGDGARVLRLPRFEGAGFIAGFSTRCGGVSRGSRASLNLSYSKAGDAGHTVWENYRILAACLGIRREQFAVSRQVHEVELLRVTAENAALFAANGRNAPIADGLITDAPGVMLVKHSADCPIVYLADPRKKAAALLHAGWRSSAARIAQKGVEAMREAFGSDPGDILAAVSPGIGPCCFEVDEPVAQAFLELAECAPHVRALGAPGKYGVDLSRCNIAQLEGAGVLPQNRFEARICTYCNGSLFYSHRRDKGRCGHQVAVLGIPV